MAPGSGFNLIADALLPPPTPRRPVSRSRSAMSMSRAASANGNKKRNSIIVDRVLKRNSTFMSDRPAVDAAPQSGGPGRGGMVRRWDGNKTMRTDWDSIRRDPELWFPSGDALVHLYGPGQSRRGPSFRVPFADIERSGCGPLLSEALAGEPETASSHDSSSDGGFSTNPCKDGKWELYIPAPGVLDREQAYKHHLTTRNFFAWMFDKPLVGSKLGDALISLHERMDMFRLDRDQNQDDMLAYIDSQGYTDFRDCPDHALGVLQYAETFELAELWTDAFVHCSGMNDQLVSSHDFDGVSRTTKALITRANLEMSVRLEHASVSLTNFMEDDLGFLKLDEPVARHVERFRSFLHSYFVQRNGYWPPTSAQPVERGRQRRSVSLSKNILLSMYSDFRNLYELLADLEAPPGRVSLNSAANDGFDISKTISQFDKRQKFSPLPSVLPLLPENLTEVSESRFSSFFPSLFGKRTTPERRTGALAALHHATNISSDPSVMHSSLVIEYFRFERQYTLNEEERLSPTEARKARWLLVYAILQTLADVTKAPSEVRDTEGVDYPLCCQTAGTPPWSPNAAGRPSLTTTATRSSAVRRRSSRTSLRSSLTQYSLHSAAPSARVDPLDLELVASKRRSYAQPAPTNRRDSRSSSITRSPLHLSAPPPIRTSSMGHTLDSNSSTPMLSPTPRRASVQGKALIATYDASEEDLPALSSGLARTDSNGRHSEETSSGSEADTPTSTKFTGTGLAIVGGHEEKGIPAPPSPSIYDGEAGPTGSEFNLLMGHRRVDSDELARRWQGEIGIM